MSATHSIQKKTAAISDLKASGDLPATLSKADVGAFSRGVDEYLRKKGLSRPYRGRRFK